MIGRLSVKGGCVCLLLVGCGSVRDLGNIPDGGAGTAGSGGAGQGGATGAAGVVGTGGTGGGAGGGGGAPKCRTDVIFDAPVLLDGVNSTSANSDDGAQLSPDELTVYFASSRSGDAGGWNLWTATRPALGQPFARVTALSQVNSSSDDSDPSVTADGLTLYYTKAEGGNTAPWRIYRSTRSSIEGAFGPGALVPDVNVSGTVNGQSYVMPDGSALYYIASAGGGGQEIWRAQAAAGGRFDPPVHLSELGSSADESSPVVTADELTIYFGSTRSGGAGGVDIWMASRNSTAEPFGTPRNVAELNSGANYVPSWISPDTCRLYLWADAIYVASRRP
jgi:Tol biopolymer transport system component